MAFPAGSLPYDYSYLSGYPIERDTENGMEVSVVYVGPSADRWRFLEKIFGKWSLTEEIVEDDTWSDYDISLCATLEEEPNCLHLRSGHEDGGDAILYDHLWPDSFTIKPVGNPAPYINEHEDEESMDLLRRSLEYDCLSEITVNYRSKYYAGWPNWFLNRWRRMGDHPRDLNGGIIADGDCFLVPTIPEGTFIDVQQTEKIEVQTIYGRNLEFDTSEPGWQSGSDEELEAKLTLPIQIVTTNIQITWSNVPIVPKDDIAICRGHVNSKSFLGYPVGSVYFAGHSIKARTPFYQRWQADDAGDLHKGLDLNAITYNFVAKTVRSYYDRGGTTTGGKQCFDQMGYFNRRWHPVGIPDQAADAYSAAIRYRAGMRCSYNGSIWEAMMTIPPGNAPSATSGWWIHQSSDIASYMRLVQGVNDGPRPIPYMDLNHLFDLEVCSP